LTNESRLKQRRMGDGDGEKRAQGSEEIEGKCHEERI
jgi:hypothetical protein